MVSRIIGILLIIFAWIMPGLAVSHRQANAANQAQRPWHRRQMGGSNNGSPPAVTVSNPNMERGGVNIGSNQKSTSKSSSDYIRACYFTNWSQYRPGKGKFTPEDYQPGLCTHILFAFGWMNQDFTVRAYDPADLTSTSATYQKGLYQRVNDLKSIDPELKTLLSIGGWTFGTELFKSMSTSAKTRKIFIDSAVSFVRLHKFDGLDIDWEYPQGAEDKRNFAVLMKELHESFDDESTRTNRPQLLLAAAVSAAETTINNGYDIPELARYLDFIDVMTYDFHGAWERTTGMNSPLRGDGQEAEDKKHWNVEWAVRHWHDGGMPAEKIVVGLPTYGRGWTMPVANKSSTYLGPGAQADGPSKATEFVQEPGVAAYYEICQMLEQGAVRRFDDRQHVPYLTYQDQWFSYDDAESYKKKIQWVKDNGYGGVFMWTLDFDDFGGFCASSRGKKFPLIGLVRDLMAESPRHTKEPPINHHQSITPATPTQMATKATSAWQPVTFGLERPPPLLTDPCQGSTDGFFPYPGASCNHFLLCLHGSAYAMSCPPTLEFSPTLHYCVRQPSGCGQLRQEQQAGSGGDWLMRTPAAEPEWVTLPAATYEETTRTTAVPQQWTLGVDGGGAAYAVEPEHPEVYSPLGPGLPDPYEIMTSLGPALELYPSTYAPRPEANFQYHAGRLGTPISHPPASSSNRDPVEPAAKTSATFICPVDGYHPDPTDCARFYRCFISIPYEFHCPDGLLYNIETQVCDAPMNVQCTH